MVSVSELPRRLVRGFTRWYPLMSGCGTLANTPPVKAVASLGAPVATARLKSGVRLEVRLDDYVGRALYFFGDLDPKVTAVVNRVLEKGDQVLDIGANIGVVTMAAAQRVGPSGVVHAFEPQPDLCQMIQRSAALNGFSHVKAHALALSESDTEVDFFAPDANRGTASLSRSHSGPGQTFRVQCRRAGDYLNGLQLTAPRLLKIDVEGHEAVVFKASESFFARSPPDVILFESNEGGDFWSRQPVQWLLSQGYSLLEVQRSRLRLKLRSLAPPRLPQPTSNDYVAVHRSPRRPVPF